MKGTNAITASIPQDVTVSDRTSRLKSALRYGVSDNSGELLVLLKRHIVENGRLTRVDLDPGTCRLDVPIQAFASAKWPLRIQVGITLHEIVTNRKLLAI